MTMPNLEDVPSRRDLEHLSAAVEKLTLTIENLPQMMAATYVRKDVYRSDQKVHDATHAEQRNDIDSLTTAKEWLVRAVVSAAVIAPSAALLVRNG